MRFAAYHASSSPHSPLLARVAAAKRAVQAEKDRLFPELVRYSTTQRRLGCHARAPYHLVARTPQSRRRKLTWSPSYPKITNARPARGYPPLLADLLAARSPRLSP